MNTIGDYRQSADKWIAKYTRSLLCLVLTVLAIGLESASAQPAPLGDLGLSAATSAQGYSLVGRNGDRKVWQRVDWVTNVLAHTMRPVRHSYVELRAGASKLVNGQWVDSDPTLEVSASGAQGTNTQFSVSFLGNINSGDTPAVTVTTPDGKQLGHTFLGLSYLDGSSGQSVFIAETKDSVGQLLSSRTEAMYPDCLSGVTGDLLYVNSVSGLEQFVLLRSQLPDPSGFSINPAACMLQAITDFGSNAPQPRITEDQVGGQPDDFLDFGLMTMGPGFAFALGAETNQVPVTKRWLLSDTGHWCLIEQVPFTAIQPFLQGFPPPPTASTAGTSPRVLTARLVLPARRRGSSRPTAFKLAQGPLRPKGFAMDYSLLLSQTNITLQGDTTYYVSGTVNVTNLVIEGGTCVKFTNTAAATIIAGTVTCKTGPYRMAAFTSKDDNSIGDTISGSTGSPTNCALVTYLQRLGSSNGDTYDYLRFAYANTGISAAPATGGVWHCQFISCGTAYHYSSTGNLGLHNVLFARCGACVYAGGATAFGENLTVDTSGFKGYSSDSGYITNSIFTAVTNTSNYAFYSSVTNSSNAGFYQTVGAGDYYLAADSPYRNAGTTAISPALAGALKSLTTYPPLVYAEVIVNSNLYFFPQAQRDQGTPDLGYHYAPVDYAIGFLFLTNATLTMIPGTVVATFGTNSGTYGLGLTTNAILACQGSPTALARFVAFDLVQEEAASGWSQPYYAQLTDEFTYGPPLACNCRFTDFSLAGQDCMQFFFGSTPANFQDCQFHGGTSEGDNVTMNFTNCLFERVVNALDPTDSLQPVYRNNLCYGGELDWYPSQTNSIVKDNLFDQTAIYTGFSSTSQYIGGFNATVSGFNQVSPPYPTDLVLASSPSYRAGPLGSYYRVLATIS